MKYPNWTDFDINEICYGISAPIVGIGVYTLDRKFSWPDMEGVTDVEYQNWVNHLKQNGYEIPSEYIKSKERQDGDE